MQTFSEVVKQAYDLFFDRTGYAPLNITISRGDGAIVRLDNQNEYMEVAVGGAAADMDALEYTIENVETRVIPFDTWTGGYLRP